MDTRTDKNRHRGKHNCLLSADVSCNNYFYCHEYGSFRAAEWLMPCCHVLIVLFHDCICWNAWANRWLTDILQCYPVVYPRVGRSRAHPAPAVLGHGIRADPKSFLGEGWGNGGLTRQQTCVEKPLTAANCLYISRFWGPGPHVATTLTSEPAYATDVITWLQVKHGDVVQVSLIIISLNSSTHLGRYTLTASNAAGTAAASIVLRLTSLSSSSPSSSVADVYDDDGDAKVSAVVLQPPDSGYQQLTGVVLLEFYCVCIVLFLQVYQRFSAIICCIGLPIHCNCQLAHYSGFWRISPSILNRFTQNLQA